MVIGRDELLKREEAAWAEFVAEVGRVPEHRRGEDGRVPGLVRERPRVPQREVGRRRGGEAGARSATPGAAGEEDPDEVWEGKNELWAAESKSMLYQEAMARALGRSGARAGGA